MTDVPGLKRRFIAMLVFDSLLLCIGAAFAVGYFVYGLGWGLWAFIGCIAAAFLVQLWFIGGAGRRLNKEM